MLCPWASRRLSALAVLLASIWLLAFPVDAAAQPTATKTVFSTSLSSTTGDDLAIGEIVTYQVDITIPDGQTLTGVTLSETLAAGMVYLGASSATVSASPGLTTTVSGGFSEAIAAATMSGTTLSLNLGTVENTDNDVGSTETLSIQYSAVATNSAGNQAGTTLGASATFTSNLGSLPITAPTMRIVEPQVSVDLALNSPFQATAEAGDLIDYKMTITAASGGTNASAHDVQVNYPLPTGMVLNGFVTTTSGPSPTNMNTSAGLVSLTYAQIAAGTTIELQFYVALLDSVGAGATLTSTVSHTYTSLPGDVSTPQVPGNNSTVERTGAGGLNDYAGSDSDIITTHSSTISGYVYVDRDANGVYSYLTDPILPDVGITLTGTDHTGAAVSRSTTTGSDGAYTFGALRAGTYTLTQPIQPAGYLDGPDRAGQSPNGTSLANGDEISNIVLPRSASTNAAGYDFSELSDVDLSLTLAASRTAVRPGDTVDFTVKVRNPSFTSSVYDPVATIILPKGLTVTGTSNQTGWNCTEPAASVLRCTTIALPPDFTSQFVFSTAVAAGVVDHTRLQTVASVTTSKSGDWNSRNNTDTLTMIVPAAEQADLGVTLTAPTQMGNDALVLNLTAIVTNHGATPSAATVTFSSSTSGVAVLSEQHAPAGTSCEIGETTVCAIPTLAAGESVTITLEIQGESGRRSLQAAVAAAGTDPNPDNDAAVVETTWGTIGQAEVQLTTTAPHAVAAGQRFWVKHVVNNAGLAAASSVTVADTGAANALTPLSAFPVCPVPCVVGTLNPNDTYIFYEQFEVPGGHAAGPLTLTRTVTSSTSDAYAGNDTSSVTVLVADAGHVNLTTTLFDTPDPIVSGHALELVALVTNEGPATATAATLALTTPSEFPASPVLRHTSAGSCTGADCALGLVRPGETALVAFSLETPNGVPSTNPVTSTVSVAADAQTDADLASNTATQQTTLMQQSNLEITKTVTGTVVAGSPFVYSITVTNSGPSAAPNVVVSDTPANGTTFVSNAGDCATAFPCALGTLAVGETRTITSTYSLSASYTTPATFSAAATVSSGATDPVLSDNSSAPLATVSFSADLRTSVSGPTSVAPGQSLTYTVTVTNDGPSDATNVQFSNPIPAGLRLSSVSSPCAEPAYFPCVLGTIASGQSESVTIIFDVPSNYAGTNPIANSASAGADTPDPESENNASSASTTVAPSADLGVTMTAPSATQTGRDVTFTITVTNNGPSDVTDPLVSEATPLTGLTFVGTSNSCPSFPCGIGGIASGASKSITATYHVPAGYTTPDPIVHTVLVSSSADDANIANDAASASIAASTDLSVTLTDAPDPATAGSDLSYTITVTNNGPMDAIDVSVADTLPAGTTFVSAVPVGGGSCTTPAAGAHGTVTCTWTGVTPVAGARVLFLTVKIDPATTQGAVISNTVTVSSGTNDSTPGNNSAMTTTAVSVAADIAVSMTADATFVPIGAEAVFTVTVQNLGPSHATGLAITDALPLGLAYVDSTPSQGSYDAVTGVWTVGALQANASATLQLRVRVEEAGSRVNTAVKTAGDQPDPNGANNSAAINLTSQPTADVSVSKTVNVSSANVGDTVTFTITVGNAGPNDATAVRIVDNLPPGLTYVSSSASTGSFEPNGVWQLGTLAMNAQATLTIDAIVNDAGTILNQAYKSGQGEDDPNPANDSSGATVNGLSADIQVVTTLASDTEVQVGGEVRFFVTTTNNGPSPATGVRVRDLLPPGLAYLSSTVTRGVYVPATGAWEIGDLAATGPEATAVLELRARLLSLDGLTNEARVLASDQLDPVVSNNRSAVFPPTTWSDLVFDIDVAGDPGLRDSMVDYTFQVRNDGSGATMSPLTVAIPLPPEYEYVSVQPAGLRANGPVTAAAAAAWACTQVRQTVFCRSDAALAPNEVANLVVRLRVKLWLAADRSLFAYLATPGGEGVPVRMQQFYLGSAADAEADLSVTQSLRVEDGIPPSKTLTFTVDVVNNGPREASDVVLTDVLPPGVTYVWAKGPRGACGRTDDFISCEIGSIAPGARAQVTVDIAVDAPAGVIHSVGVSSGSYDPALGNNFHVLAHRLEASDYTDTDEDGMPDGWESLVGLSVTTNDADDDADGDGVSNLDEYRRGTHPRGTESRYFAEGAANEFFQTTIAVLNPDAEAFASVMIELLLEDGSIRSVPHLLAPLGRVELDPRTLLPGGGAFSVQVESDRPVAVDRDMRWDGTGYGSSGESGAPETSTTWYFAEGATNPYSLFYLVENPSMTEIAQLQVSYLLPDGQPIVVTDSVAPHSRKTIFVNDLATTHPELRATEVAATFTSTNNVPIVVERAMYLNLPGQPMGAGHAGLGATSPSASWFFAEGATGGFFKEYVLLANPQATMTRATVRYLLPDGSSFDRPYDLQPMSRRTIDVAGEDERLAATTVSAVVTATQPIVAERVMWWPNAPASPYWYEAHVSLGATSTGTVWAIAGASSGGRWAEQTYALVANQEAYDGEVIVTVTVDGGQQASKTFPLAATSRQTIDFAAEFPLVHGQHFSALIESVGVTPAPIAVEWSRYGSTGGQFWSSGSAALATKVR